ncbi:thiolase domain-containing protein [Frankia sp. AgB1.9]|uniref:thiolase domain-containing protein n=1 Tax=unclassified Frankia TaxID=2632575 RepID=UPI001933D35B|nr:MULTISPECIES: thiolase domain-containing protein [unclassified Frankia]MBL7491830.1 thiolase domain-containing protein [Frankia sp. AgW1.1]MBL7549745.1 thiolase domain-containing protein [Frankia sp. AgB1.9]MBL7618047.1 thiolase domain-containing protein [Frankia sp. AgB1.8]
MSGEPCAIIGIGQTHHKSKRLDVSLAGLVREAASRALEDAGLDWPDIDAVVLGKAPDAFEGVMMPELYLADALGAAGKSIMRVHTAGSVGGSTAIVASHLIHARRHRRVLAVAFEKQSEGNAQWGLSGGKSGSMGAGGIFAPWIRSYIRRSGAPEHIGWQVAVKDRRNALKNPYAHLKIADISMEKVRDSFVLWDPLHFLESCPSSDGACALVLTDEAGGRDAAARGNPPAWVAATAMRSEPTSFPSRDPVRPQAGVDCAHDLYRAAGITNPLTDIDVAELYVPFSWYEPMWLEGHDITGPGDGWKLVEAGETEIGGSFPVNPSGGVLSSNPIGASGMLRFAEAALQVRGRAGEHQVDGARTALGHAYGGGAQYFAMWIVRSSL